MILPIIIVNWNGLRDTIECIESIINSKFENYKIYLIDNNSKAEEITQIKKAFLNNSQIEVILSDKNHGFTKACNIVLQKIGNIDWEYCFLINNDTIVSHDIFHNILEFQKQYKADLVSCKMIDYYDRTILDNVGHKMISTGEIIPIGNKESSSKYNEPFENFGACGGAALYSKKMLKTIGYFDEYFNTGYEDAELGYRAKLAGFSTLYCPNALIYHKGGNSIKKVFNEEYAIKNQKNILYTIFKLYPIFLLLIYVPIILLKTSLIVFLSTLFGKLKYARILLKANFYFFKNDLRKALSSRNDFNTIRRKGQVIKTYFKQESFLIFDLKRFFSFLILRKKSALDNYR